MLHIADIIIVVVLYKSVYVYIRHNMYIQYTILYIHNYYHHIYIIKSFISFIYHIQSYY